jgi:hypothetical protein
MIFDQSQINELRRWAREEVEPSPSRLEISTEPNNESTLFSDSARWSDRVMARAYCVLSPICFDEQRLS